MGNLVIGSEKVRKIEVIHVLFFARFRETLGTAMMELPYSAELATVGAVEEELVRRGGDRWGEVFGEDNLIRAVNQVVAEANTALADGDEVAFYPPVTGG